MIVIFPILAAVIIILLGFFIMVLVKAASRVVYNKRITKKQILGFAIPLASLDAVYCFYLYIKICLSHGSRSLAAIFPLQCILTFLVIVAFPTGVLIIGRHYRSRSIAVMLSGVYAVIMLASLIWYTPGITSLILDDTGRPLKGAYVFYYRPRYFFFSNWDTYTFTRTDEKGSFAIPADVQFQFPFEYWVPFAKRVTWYLRYLTIYASRLHNLAVVYDANTGQLMDNPHRLAITRQPGELVITLHDMTAGPEDRFDLLLSFFYRTSFAELTGPEGDLRELLSAVKEEYRTFAAQYGNTMRDKAVGVEKPEQPHPWIFYLQGPINGKTMKQRMVEIDEVINKRYRLR